MLYLCFVSLYYYGKQNRNLVHKNLLDYFLNAKEIEKNMSKHLSLKIFSKLILQLGIYHQKQKSLSNPQMAFKIPTTTLIATKTDYPFNDLSNSKRKVSEEILAPALII